MTTATATQTIQPYLFFNGRCKEALEFYKKALGAEVGMVMHFKDNPEPQSEGCPGGGTPDPDAVMHASFSVKGSTVMASDGMSKEEAKFEGFTLSVSADDEAEAKGYFAALSEGGTVKLPLTKTFFAASFGMVEDRFGVSWMVIVHP